MAKLCAAGVTFDVATDAQLAELEAAVRPVIDKLRADPAKAAQLDQIEALKFEVAAPPNTLACTPQPGAQGADSLGIPDGTYTRTVTVGGHQAIWSGSSAQGNRNRYHRRARLRGPRGTSWCSPTGLSPSTTLTP